MGGFEGEGTGEGRAAEGKAAPIEHVRVVSDSSSFLRFMRSLSVSASRRACWIRSCMASGDTSLAPWEFIVTRRDKAMRETTRASRGRATGGRDGEKWRGERREERRRW